MPKDAPPHLWSIDPVTREIAGRMTRRDCCACLAVRTKKGVPLVPNLHVEPQDQRAAGWAEISRLVDEAAETGATIFEPSAHMAWEDWSRVITLPAGIAQLG